MEKFSDVSMQSSKGPNQDLKVDSEVDGGTCEDSEDSVRSSQQRSEQPADVPKNPNNNKSWWNKCRKKSFQLRAGLNGTELGNISEEIKTREAEI